MRRIAVLDAPSNLGLRPPTPTSVPGCGKAPGALRDHGLLARLGARDAGCLTPPRYDPGNWRPGDGVCHAEEIAGYSLALAERIGSIIDMGEFPVILGGDCSILIGSALAMHRLGEAVGGRIGLVFVDGHSDFRHPGNASYVGAAAGEDLALVTGRGQADLAAIEGRRPYFRDIDVVVLGIRAQDEYRLDLQAAGILTRPVPQLRAEGAARTAQWAHDELADCVGYWVHIDVDVLDPAVLPAVDAPDPGGIAFPELELLLAGLVDTPHCLGVEVTVFDPDYDPDGAYAAEIVSTLVAGLAPVVEPPATVPRLVSSRSARDTGEPSRVPAARTALDARPEPPRPPEADPPVPDRPQGVVRLERTAETVEVGRAVEAAGVGRAGEPTGVERAFGAAVVDRWGSAGAAGEVSVVGRNAHAEPADRVVEPAPPPLPGRDMFADAADRVVEPEAPAPPGWNALVDTADRGVEPAPPAPPEGSGTGRPIWLPEPVGPPGSAGPGRLRPHPMLAETGAGAEPGGLRPSGGADGLDGSRDGDDEPRTDIA